MLPLRRARLILPCSSQGQTERRGNEEKHEELLQRDASLWLFRSRYHVLLALGSDLLQRGGTNGTEQLGFHRGGIVVDAKLPRCVVDVC